MALLSVRNPRPLLRSVSGNGRHIRRMPTPPHPSPPGPERLLASSAHEGARRLCQWLAHDAELAVTEIDADGKAGIAARHHLRVTLRRLRVTLDAYDSVLEDAAPRKLSRRAATLARLVGAARDRDVQDGLLASVTRTRTATQRKALARLEHDLTPDGGLDATAIRHRWGRLAKSLRNGLASWQEYHRLDGPRGPFPFAHVAADALERAADRAARRCGRVTATSELEVIHLARIGLKFVRYLLAPLAPCESDAAAMIAVLRDAQHQLGTICDAHLLRVRIIEARMTKPNTPPLPARTIGALVACERDLDARITTAFRAFEPWRDATSRHGFVARLHAIAAGWRAGGAPPMEIERKWLLTALPPRVRGLTPAVLQQGYLPGETLVERIRSVTRGAATEWIRTVKLGRGIARVEVEETSSVALGESLFALTAGKRVSKRRYTVDESALTWEIDEFTDRTLVLAEVELPREDTPVDLPVWLAPYVVREVTDESEFTNWRLAR